MKRVLSFVLLLAAVTALVVGVSMATTYFILKHGLQQRIANQNKSTVLIANQIKSANINSILAFTDEFFIFVVHQRDGRLLFESAKKTGADQKIWDENRDALIKEILKKHTGVLTYPESGPWQVLPLRKRVEYQFIPDLDWIVAVELPEAISAAELLSVYTPFVCSILGLFCMLTTSIFFYSRNKGEDEAPFSEKFEASLQADLPRSSAEETQEPILESADEERENPAPQEGPQEAPEIIEQPAASTQEPPAAIIEQPPHVIDTPQYTQRLIQQAQKALKPQEPPAKSGEPALDEIEVKEHIKRASAYVRQEQAASTKEEPKKAPDEAQSKPAAPKDKKASEIYFDHIISGGKKKEKPVPNSIIGMALSKKDNTQKNTTQET